jgi:signal transduction histidine kinase
LFQYDIEVIKKIKTFILYYRAIFFILGLGSISIAGVLSLFNISNNTNIRVITRACLYTSQNALTHLEINTSNMLTATMETLLSNEEITASFSERDRDRLYQLVYPLFKQLKNQNNITHWYFLNPEPEKTCFLRVHAPHKFNDQITRVTLDSCIKSKTFVSGKELGKTGLALRAVHPYYDKGQLIGYLELGVEMEYFFRMLKQQTGNEYGLLINKKFLDEAKWATVTAEKEIPNNRNDFEHFLLVNKTFDALEPLILKKHLESPGIIPDAGMVLEMITKNQRYFVRGIFPFYDASGKKVGGIFILKDITTVFNAMQVQERKIITMIILFMGIITFFMVFFHKRAGRELKKYRARLEELVKERTAELLETNKRLNLEIKRHMQVQEALKGECKAREEAEKKQVKIVKHLERSARLASIGVMAASITHEINQPLNAIKVTADSIQYWHKRNPGVLPDIFINQLNIISRSVNRIVEIIQHMRSFWVVPHMPGVSVVNINKAVKNALSLTRQQMHAHGVQERVNLGADPLTIEGNLVHYEQIIVNLLVNAIHALDERERQDKEIRIKTRRQDQWVQLVIEDNGPGLPIEDPKKLFDPFFSTHLSGEGMGLGLAIVKRYVDLYNGAIEAQDKADGGAVFTIKFPFLEDTGDKNADTRGG